MRLYNIGALIKLVVGLAILAILYNYVNVYQDPAIGISFGFLGVFMIVRGLTYFIFLGAYSVFSTYPQFKQASLSYKLSLLLGMYVMVNLTLVITDHWTRLAGLLVLVCFVVIQMVFSPTKKQPISY